MRGVDERGTEMRKVIVSEFLTLDGVMQAPGDPDEDRRGGFRHGGWQLSYFDEVLGSAVTEGLSAAGGLLLGRRTYEIFAAYWPSAPADIPIAPTINHLPKYVASRTLEEPLQWENSTLLKGDVAKEVAKLKDQSAGDLLVIGSGDLVQTLMQNGLVDEYQLMVHPFVLGTGARLFQEGTPRTALRLADTKTTGAGVLILTYQPAEKEA
jgi:dihydrofolate reductase